MSRTCIYTIVVLAAACVAIQLTADAEPPNQGVGEQIGSAIDRGLNSISGEIQQGWAEVRQGIDRLSIEGRVYSRLHWDKALNLSAVDVESPSAGVIVLKGSVTDRAVQQRAVNLAEETLGVERAIDQLAIAPRPGSQK